MAVKSNRIAAAINGGLPFEAVVFDYDDTLAETLPARIEAMRRTFAAYGITCHDTETFVHAMRGVPLQTALDGFEDGRGKALGLTAAYRRFYWHKEPGFIYLYPGVREMLDVMLDGGVRLGLLTSKVRDISVEGRRAGVSVELEELGIDGHFLHTVGFEDVAQAKPHPEGLYQVMQRLRARAETTLVVGDSWSDIEAAANGGCRSCLATWGLREPAAQLARCSPDFVAARPAEVLAMLQGAT